jgi:hypothetical protein
MPTNPAQPGKDAIVLHPHDQAVEEVAMRPSPIPCLSAEGDDEDENWGAGEPGVDYEDDEDL